MARNLHEEGDESLEPIRHEDGSTGHEGKSGHDAGTAGQEPQAGHGIDHSPQIDLDRLRLSQDFQSLAGVKKVLRTVPVRKPDGQVHVRARRGFEWRLNTAVLHLKDKREMYLVHQDLWSELLGELVWMALITAITRQDVIFIWPVRLPGADGRLDPWNSSALEAVTMAMDGWVRVTANMSLGAYEIFSPSATLPDPTWPDVDFSTLIRLAFRDRYITTLDHPVIRRLRGEL